MRMSQVRVLPPEPNLTPSSSHSIGNLSQAKVWARLIERDYRVFAPIGDGDQIDLIMIPPGSSTPSRVQVKTGRLQDGAISFATCTSNWRSLEKIAYDEIDYFAVYCPETESVYLIPFSETPQKTKATLRIDPAGNGMTHRIRWAKDYEIK